MIEKNFSYTIPDGPHAGTTLWSGRYCCVATFVFMKKNGAWHVLANQRGPGVPDFAGYWNVPCGFLESNESGQEGAVRELAEETGVFIVPNELCLYDVETEPEQCNKGHVTLLYYCIINDYSTVTPNGGEENEVLQIKWIPIQDIDKYQWAFHHDELIKKTINFALCTKELITAIKDE